MNTLLLLILGGAALYAIKQHQQTKPVGKLSDEPLELENILMGVSRGWYTARPQILDGFGTVVWLSGKKANGEEYEDVYPISREVYDALLANGIGKLPKRRIYNELAEAQEYDELDLSQPYNRSWDSAMWRLGKKFGYKGSKNSTKSYPEQYYNSLQRAYNAIAGVGYTTLPYKESIVYNNHGDEILRYRDYGTDDEKINEAIEQWSSGVNETAMFWKIMGMIIRGEVKLLWDVSEREKQAGKKGLRSHLFGNGKGERKNFRHVLASKEKGGVTPEAFAHRLWEGQMDRGQLDDMQILNVLLEAVYGSPDPKDARRFVLEKWYEQHAPEWEYYNPETYEQQSAFDNAQLQQDDELQFEDRPF